MMFVSSPTGNSDIISQDDLEETGIALKLKTCYTSHGFGFTDSNLQGGGDGGSFVRHNSYNNYASLYPYSQDGVTMLNRSVYTLISLDLDYLVPAHKEDEQPSFSFCRDERVRTLLDSSSQPQSNTTWVNTIFGAAFASDGYAYTPGAWVQDFRAYSSGPVVRTQPRALTRPDELGTTHAAVDVIRWGAGVMHEVERTHVEPVHGNPEISTHPPRTAREVITRVLVIGAFLMFIYRWILVGKKEGESS